MNNVEQMLSVAADLVEDRLGADTALCDAIKLLLANRQSPHVMRVLRNIPGAVVTIEIGPQPA